MPTLCTFVYYVLFVESWCWILLYCVWNIVQYGCVLAVLDYFSYEVYCWTLSACSFIHVNGFVSKVLLTQFSPRRWQPVFLSLCLYPCRRCVMISVASVSFCDCLSALREENGLNCQHQSCSWRCSYRHYVVIGHPLTLRWKGQSREAWVRMLIELHIFSG